MTHLREKMLDELQRRNYSQRTAKMYIRIVRDFAEHFHRSPDKLGPEHIRQYQAHLFQAKKSENPHVARIAAMVLRFARVKPYRTRRLKFLAQKHPELLRELEDTGLVLSHGWDWETAGLSGKENSEGTEISFGEDSETIELSDQDDWAIPF